MFFDLALDKLASVCHVVGASEFFEEAFVVGDTDIVIAADGGLRHLLQRNIRVDVVLGDFDSLGYTPENAIVLPTEKDDTDVLFAVKLGMERGFQTFFLHGCLGGRMDHSFANMQILKYISESGGRGYLFGENCTMTAVTDGVLDFGADAMGTISVFSADDKSTGVDLVGLKYPLDNYTMRNSFPIGVSNEFTGKVSKVSVGRGTLFVMWQQI